jgi:hypothetical protein
VSGTDAKSIWVVLLVLLLVYLVWLWATGRGANAVAAFGASIGAPPGSTTASPSAVPPATASSTAAGAADPVQYVQTSATQSQPVYVPAVTTSSIYQQIEGLVQPTSYAPSSANYSIPTYISSAAAPVIPSLANLFGGAIFSQGTPGTSSPADGTYPTNVPAGSGFLDTSTTTPGFNPTLSYA